MIDIKSKKFKWLENLVSKKYTLSEFFEAMDSFGFIKFKQEIKKHIVKKLKSKN